MFNYYCPSLEKLMALPLANGGEQSADFKLWYVNERNYKMYLRYMYPRFINRNLDFESTSNGYYVGV